MKAQRLFLTGVVGVMFTCYFSAAESSTGLSSTKIPQPQFKYLRVGQVQPRGWLLEQLKTEAQKGYAPVLDQLTTNSKSRVDLSTFDTRNKGEMEASWWNGETTGNWLDGLIRIAYLSDDADAKRRADELVSLILSFQEEDGYLGMYTADRRYAQPAAGQNGEFWTQTCLFRGLLAYHELTGRQDVLAAVKRAVDLSISKYDKNRPYWPKRVGRGGPGHNFMFVDICEWLWNLTEDKKYIEFAQFLYDSYNEVPNVFDTDILLTNLADPEKLLEKHGAHVMEHLRVPLFVGYATGEAKYKPAVDNIFLKVYPHLTAGGAIVSDEDILGRLGSPDIGCEYCPMFELLHSLESGVQKTGRADLGDRIEVLAFNSAQGARLRDSKAIQYCTRDNQHYATIDSGRGGRFKLSPTHEDVAVCCPVTAMKFFPYLVNYGLWMKEADGSGLVAVAYAPNRVKTSIGGIAVAVKSETAYPFEDGIRMSIEMTTPAKFSMRLRIPAWNGGMEVTAPGAEARREDGWFVLTKQWRDGDEITLTFTPEVIRKTAANGSGSYWQRGPLVYSLPIASESKKTKDYPVAGFADWDYTPIAGSFWDYSLDADTGTFVFQSLTPEPGADLWQSPPLAIDGSLRKRTSGEVERIRLVPMGSALLRHTVFVDSSLVTQQPTNQPEWLKSASNLARIAEVFVANSSKGYQRNALIDGVAEGFPANTATEWASARGGVGTKVKLAWEMPEEVSCLWLFDRPNENDHILSTQIEFSDGSSVEAGPLPNDGKDPFVLQFPSKTITWMEITVMKVGPRTRNVGYSEIAVFEKDPLQHTVLGDKILEVKQTANPSDWLKSAANLARKAELTVANTAKGYQRNALIDGVAEGYPDNAAAEWASDFGLVGTKVKLAWEMPEEVSCLWLFDRPNKYDHVQAAKVVFSDGSSVETGPLPNDGKNPFVLRFASKTITWMEITVTKVGPQSRNVGYSEIAVFEKDPSGNE